MPVTPFQRTMQIELVMARRRRKILSFWHLNIFGNTVFEVFPSLKYLKIFACGEQQLFRTYKQTYIENRKSDQSNHGPPPGGVGGPSQKFSRNDLCARYSLQNTPVVCVRFFLTLTVTFWQLKMK